MKRSIILTPETPEEWKAILSLAEVETPATGQPSEPQMQYSTPTCEQCGATMVKRTGEKNGKAWAGWFCTKSTKEDKHPVKWLRA
jgi:hypothetical protein